MKGRWVMRISGYGEFESIRKTVQKDDSVRKKETEEKTTVTSKPALDQADVSASARMYQMRDKAVEGLKKIPDPREEKVNEILEKMEKGTLMTPDAVKESIGRMLDRGITY